MYNSSKDANVILISVLYYFHLIPHLPSILKMVANCKKGAALPIKQRLSVV